MAVTLLIYIIDALRLAGEAQCVQADWAWGDQTSWRGPLDLRAKRRREVILASPW